MEKLEVKICTGTACYVVGGAELLTIEDELTPEELELIKITGSTCLGLCDNYNSATPYAKVGDEIIGRATVELLAEKIREALKKQTGE